jgi:hypothetical protein
MLRCDYAQGYYFARPMDSAQLGDLLESRRAWALPLASASGLLLKPR